MMKINAKEFKYAPVTKLMKYEYPFLGKDETSTRNFLMAEDPYSISKNDALRATWMEEAKLLFGHFKPSGPAHPIQTVSKSVMKDIVDCVKKLLLSDWNDVNFVLGSKYTFVTISIANPNDFIEIKFDVDTVDNLLGLHSYMNTMLNTNPDVCKYQLRKIS
jgi:hypothetical protein